MIKRERERESYEKTEISYWDERAGDYCIKQRVETKIYPEWRKKCVLNTLLLATIVPFSLQRPGYINVFIQNNIIGYVYS